MNEVTGKWKREVGYLRPAIYFALTKKKIIDETLNREIKKPKEMLSYFKLSNAPKDNSKKVSYPVGIYLLNVNNRNTRTRCEICSKLTIKTPWALFWCLYC